MTLNVVEYLVCFDCCNLIVLLHIVPNLWLEFLASDVPIKEELGETLTL